MMYGLLSLCGNYTSGAEVRKLPYQLGEPDIASPVVCNLAVEQQNRVPGPIEGQIPAEAQESEHGCATSTALFKGRCHSSNASAGTHTRDWASASFDACYTLMPPNDRLRVILPHSSASWPFWTDCGRAAGT